MPFDYEDEFELFTPDAFDISQCEDLSSVQLGQIAAFIRDELGDESLAQTFFDAAFERMA